MGQENQTAQSVHASSVHVQSLFISHFLIHLLCRCDIEFQPVCFHVIMGVQRDLNMCMSCCN